MYDKYNRHVRFCNSPNQRGALALQRHASQQAKKKCTAMPLTDKANNQSCTPSRSAFIFLNTSLTMTLDPVPGSLSRISVSNLAGVSMGNASLNACILGWLSVRRNMEPRPRLWAFSSSVGTAVRHGWTGYLTTVSSVGTVGTAGVVSIFDDFLFNVRVVGTV